MLCNWQVTIPGRCPVICWMHAGKFLFFSFCSLLYNMFCFSFFFSVAYLLIVGYNKKQYIQLNIEYISYSWKFQQFWLLVMEFHAPQRMKYTNYWLN